MSRKAIGSISALMCSALALATGTAYAQEAPANGARNAGDDIVVTARRREERLQDVPVSVNAVSPAALQQANVLNVADLSRVAPSVTINPGASAGRAYPIFAIRGQSQQEATMLADPSVPIYIGDIVAARAQGANGALFDLSAVEVLRGPQGTLFGRNSTGGAIVLRPNKPVNRFEAMGAVTGGSRGMFNLEGMINIPLNDALQLRVAGTHRQDNGYVYDEILKHNVNGTNQQALRGSLRMFDSGTGIESITTVDWFNEDDGGTATYLFKLGNTNPATGSRIVAPYTTARGYLDFFKQFADQQARGAFRVNNGVEIFTNVNTITVQNATTFPISSWLTVKNIAGYRRIRDHVVDDPDGTINALQQQERTDFTEQVTEELQVFGKVGRLNYIAGGYFFRENGFNSGKSTAGAVNPANILTTPQSGIIGDYPVLNSSTLSNTLTGAINRSYAVFAQVDYEILDGLTLTGGIRFNTDERRTLVQNQFFTNSDPDSKFVCRFSRDLDGDPLTPETAAAALTPAQCLVDASAKFSKPTYTLSANYKIDADHMIYVAHRHGYRTGGFAARAGTESGLRNTFRPEFVNDFELGFKGKWNLGSTFLRTDLAGYYANYSDLQRTQISVPLSGGPSTTVAINVGKARIWGIEADVLFRPVEQLELTANYAYTNAKYTDFVLGGVDRSSQPFARTPKNVYTLGARFRQPLGEQLGEFSLGASLYHTDAYNANESYEPGHSDMPGYSLLNMDAGFRNILRPGLDLNFFVTNLTNKRYDFLYITIVPFGFTSYSPGQPRTFGATLRYTFGK